MHGSGLLWFRTAYSSERERWSSLTRSIFRFALRLWFIMFMDSITLAGVTHRLSWLKSSSYYSKVAIGDSSNRGEVSFRLDIQQIFAQVEPRYYWGSPSVSSRRTVSSPPRASHSVVGNCFNDVIKLLNIIHKYITTKNFSFFQYLPCHVTQWLQTSSKLY